MKNENEEYWVCAKCRWVNYGENKYCGNCGELRSEEEWIFMQCGSINPIENKYCGNCGMRYDETEYFEDELDFTDKSRKVKDGIKKRVNNVLEKIDNITADKVKQYVKEHIVLLSAIACVIIALVVVDIFIIIMSSNVDTKPSSDYENIVIQNTPEPFAEVVPISTPSPTLSPTPTPIPTLAPTPVATPETVKNPNFSIAAYNKLSDAIVRNYDEKDGRFYKVVRNEAYEYGAVQLSLEKHDESIMYLMTLTIPEYNYSDVCMLVINQNGEIVYDEMLTKAGAQQVLQGTISGKYLYSSVNDIAKSQLVVDNALEYCDKLIARV